VTGPYSQRPWLASYDPGTPAEIGQPPHPTLPALLDAAAEEFAARPAYTNFGATLDFEQLQRHARAFAGFLREHCGLRAGERVAVMLPNLLQQPICVHGALYAGAVVVNVNPLYTPAELAHQLEDAEVRVLVVLDTVAGVAAEALAGLEGGSDIQVVLATAGDMLGGLRGRLVNLLARYRNRRRASARLEGAVAMHEALAAAPLAAPVARDSEDLAFLQYTGGTTGKAKGAMLSHRNILANVEQCLAWFGERFERGQEVLVTALPLYHVFAMTANGMGMMRIGGHNLLITDPREVNSLVRTLKRYRCTGITGVNTLFNAMLHARGFEEIDFSSLKLSLAGGMALQQHVAERWQAVTGRALVEAYGLTEASPAVCMNPTSLRGYNGKIGLPISSTEVRLRREDGSEAPIGEPGELCVRGPQVMQGYWRRPEETAQVLDADGWLATGDIAVMDAQGYLEIVDRKKDLIDVSGFNVYPNEVEAVAAAHPGVLEAAAIGVPDEHSGEVVKLFVVRKDPGLDAAAVIAHCRESLTGYKVPRQVEFVDSLPKSAVGKILRRQLKS